MCGRFTNTVGPQELSERFGVNIPSATGTGRYNIAPTDEVMAVVAPEGRPEASLLRWGLVPSWAKESSISRKMINARIETVATSPAYRSLIGRADRRALQLADGYFEWLKPERRESPRQPFYFQIDRGAPFAFAALWTPAKIDDRWMRSSVVLTRDTASNPIVAAIHDRMPVILPDAELWEAWLDPHLSVPELLELCGPVSDTRLTAKPANPELNSPQALPEGPWLLAA